MRFNAGTSTFFSPPVNMSQRERGFARCEPASISALAPSRPAHGARDVETFFLFPFRHESKVQKTVKSIVRAFGCVIGRRRANSFSSHFLQVFFFSMEPTPLKIEGGKLLPGFYLLFRLL